jgi:hypothetical protein
MMGVYRPVGGWIEKPNQASGDFNVAFLGGRERRVIKKQEVTTKGYPSSRTLTGIAIAEDSG